jgi:hypothetical protein
MSLKKWGQVLPAPKVKARRPERKRWPGDLENLAAVAVEALEALEE